MGTPNFSRKFRATRQLSGAPAEMQRRSLGKSGASTISPKAWKNNGIPGNTLASVRARSSSTARGMRSALVSAGGSTLYAIGAPPGRPAWNIAVKNPTDPEKPFALVSLRDTSLSTSGVSERAVHAGEHRYAHVFDPHAGDPVEGMCQATVVAPTGTASDALTKAAFVLSRETVRRLFRDQDDVHALRIEGDCAGTHTMWSTPWSSGVFVREQDEH